MAITFMKVCGAVTLVVAVGVGTFLALSAYDVNGTISKKASFDVVQDSSQPSPYGGIKTSETQKPAINSAQDIVVKSLVSSVASQLTNYQSSNRGQLPDNEEELAGFSANYLATIDLTNPVSKAPYILALTDTPDKDVISYQPGFSCALSGETEVPTKGTARQFALYAELPSETLYCVSP